MVASKYNIIVPVNGVNYVFNLASQCLIETTEELSNYLNGNNKSLELSKEEKDSLYSNGILVDSHHFETARLKSNINALKYDNSKYGVFISTTAGCNLNCTYCYQDKRKELNGSGYITQEK